MHRCANCALNRRPETLPKMAPARFEGVRSNSTVLISSLFKRICALSIPKQSKRKILSSSNAICEYSMLKRQILQMARAQSFMQTASAQAQFNSCSSAKHTKSGSTQTVLQAAASSCQTRGKCFLRLFSIVASAALALFASRTLSLFSSNTSAALAFFACVIGFGSGKRRCAHQPKMFSAAFQQRCNKALHPTVYSQFVFCNSYRSGL